MSADGNSATLQYAYEGDLLKTITTNSTTYTNSYGDFGSKQGVKAGEPMAIGESFSRRI